MSTLHQTYRIFKFIVSGVGATATNFGVLFTLTEYAHVYYLYSSTLAFITAFTVSYLLQRFWTFDATNPANPVKQFGLFLTVAVGNLITNAILLYLLVNIFHLWYFGSAVFVGITLAFISFFLYRFIFSETKRHPAAM